MKPKHLGYLSIFTLAVTLIWLVCLILMIATAGPLGTFEQILAFTIQGGVLYWLNYLTALLTVIAAVFFFAGMYRFFRHYEPAWAFMGILFVPIYASINVFIYFAQITLVPALVNALQSPVHQSTAVLLLGQLIQQWPASAAAVFNALAYALLGIPSIIYGVLSYQRRPGLRPAGILLAANGGACLLGLLGALTQSSLLSIGTMLGGGLYLCALFFYCAYFFSAKAGRELMGD